MRVQSNRTSQFYLDNFDYEKVTLARELRGYSKKLLAEKVNKTPSSITQIESGKFQPDLDTFVSIAMALSVRPSFFSVFSETPRSDLSDCNFRSKRAATQTLKKSSVAYGRVVVQLFEYLEKLGVRFPSPDVPTFESSSLVKLEKVAAGVRNCWGLGITPLPNLMNILEEHGVFVILLDSNSSQMDAYSTYINGRPCIMLDYGKAASRQQFDLAHELGHLVLHDGADVNLAAKEREANWFGGAFLAPAELFRQDCPRRWHYGAYLDLKQQWRMSIQACMYRAKQLRIMSDSSYQWGMKQMSMRNERISEAGEFSRSKPILLSQALNLVKEDISIAQLSSDIGITATEIRTILETQQVPKELIYELSSEEEQPSVVVSIKSIS